MREAFFTPREHRIRHLPVVEPDGRLAGSISDRELRRPDRVDEARDLAHVHYLDDDMLVRDVMIGQVHVVHACDTLRNAARVLVDHHVGAVQPVRERGKVRNLFVYGTLMCDDIMQQVAGCLPERLAGVLTGYERRAVRGEHYPGLVPGAGGRVDGVVYRDVPGFAWARLDRFEGDMYRRRRVQVQLTDGATLMAQTYVVRPRFVSRLDSAEWNFSEFLRSGKAKFCRHYQGYAQLD